MQPKNFGDPPVTHSAMETATMVAYENVDMLY